MASKRNTGKKPVSRKSARKGVSRNSTPGANGLWRLSIIVFAIIGFRLLELMDIRTFEFVRTIQDAYGNTDYNLNFILLGASLAGIVTLLFSKPEKYVRNIIGGALMLIPVWFRPDVYTGSIGAQALSLDGIDPIAIVFSLSASLWCVCMLHGGDNKPKLIIGALLIAENAALCLMDNFPIDWWQLVTIDLFAVFAGLSMDFAYNGFSISTLLPAAAITAEFMLRYAEVETVTTSYITAAICAAGLFALALSQKLRRDSAGTAMTLTGIAVNALSILYLNGMLL